MRIVKIHNQLWAIGLHWSKAHLKKISKSEIRKDAQKIDAAFDVVAHRHGQHGLGASVKVGEVPWRDARSLAAYLRLPPTFQGIFSLVDINGDPCWWVVSQCDGLLASGMGDLVLDTQKAAEDAAMTVYTLDPAYEQGDIVACHTPGASLDWLAPLLTMSISARLLGRAALEPLHAIKKIHPLLLAGGIVVLLCIATWGISTVLDSRATKLSREAAHLASLSKEQRRQELLAHPEDQFTQQWLTAPLADAVAEACLPAMHDLPAVSSGWTLEGANCSGRSISVTWAHGPGAAYTSLPAMATLKNPKTAIARLALPTSVSGIPEQRSHQVFTNLLSVEAASREIYQICQATGTRLRLQFRPPEKRTIDKIDITAPWRAGDWELFEVPSMLTRGEISLFRQLATMPGLTVESILFSNEKWSIKGRIYANNK